MSGALYLLVNLFVMALPLAFSWHPKIRFRAQWRAFWPACLTVMAGFIAWDVWFAGEVWGFNEAYLLGPSVAGLPVEEWMFFVCIPYACVFTYEVIRRHSAHEPKRATWILLGVLFVVCAATALTHLERRYTALTMALSALFILYLLVRRPVWVAPFLRASLWLVLPFLLTNGVLTGLAFWEYPIWNTHPETIRDQVVWYANAETLGLRVFSIPVEDFSYAFQLIGLNVAVFEALRARRSDPILSPEHTGPWQPSVTSSL